MSPGYEFIAKGYTTLVLAAVFVIRDQVCLVHIRPVRS